MPRRDGTGPLDRGAMSGRGFGLCNENNSFNGFAGRRAGFGRGFGQGFGRGFGYCQNFAYNQVGNMQDLSQKELLKMQKDALKKRLELIDNELESL